MKSYLKKYLQEKYKSLFSEQTLIFFKYKNNAKKIHNKISMKNINSLK